MAKKKNQGGLFNARKVLNPRNLKRASKALANIESRSEIGGYQRLAEQLRRERDATVGGIERAGGRLSQNITGSYRNLALGEAQNIARQSALKNMLNTQSGDIATQASQRQANQIQGGVGNLLEGLNARGAPGGGSAQVALQQQVQAQRERLAADSAAAQQATSSQGAGYTSLASSQSQANQQRGTEAVSGLQNTIANRVGETSMKFGTNIQEALGKLAEAKAMRGAKRKASILDLRKGERDYILGKGAIGQKSQAAKIGAATDIGVANINAGAKLQEQKLENKGGKGKKGKKKRPSNAPGR